MNSVYARGLGFALLLAFSWCGAAQAVPVELDFSGIVSDSTVVGVNTGDAITFKVFADNGGANLNSQTWDTSDLISATIAAGSYSAATSGPAAGFGGFSTDASGQLSDLNFGTFQNGSDNQGNVQFAYDMDNGNPIWFTGQEVSPPSPSFGAASPPSIDNTTISLAATPLPAALPLFASGLGALGFAAARQKRKVVA